MEGVLKRVFVRFVWCEQLNPPSNKNSTEDMAKSQKQSNMLVYKIFLRRKEELWGQPVTPRGNKLTPPFCPQLVTWHQPIGDMYRNII